MKTLLLALALLPAFAAPVSAAGDVHVTLVVGAETGHAPGSSCALVVPAGADGSVLLDAAVAAGCLRSWSAVDYGTPGAPDRFVTCLDGVCGHDSGEAHPALAFLEGTYWAYFVNGQYASHGIDGYRASEGDTTQFAYEDYFGGFLLDSTLP